MKFLGALPNIFFVKTKGVVADENIGISHHKPVCEIQKQLLLSLRYVDFDSFNRIACTEDKDVPLSLGILSYKNDTDLYNRITLDLFNFVAKFTHLLLFRG